MQFFKNFALFPGEFFDAVRLLSQSDWRGIISAVLYEPAERRECRPMFAGDSETTKQIDWRIPAAWLTLCIVWSSTWLAIKVGLRDLPPISYVAIRFLVAIIALALVSAGRVRLLPLHRADYVALAFTGILMFAINYTLLFWG